MAAPPQSLCIMRLSAIGDVCHALPVVRTLQAHWPQTRITWLIGKTEARLLGDIPDIEFIVFDKGRGWKAYADLRRELNGRRFDVLLHMQTSLRSNLAGLLVPATIKLGYDRDRSPEGHGLVVNERIPPALRQHAIDGMFEFAKALGVQERRLVWDIPIPEQARVFAGEQVPDQRPVLVINPCSSASKRVARSWSMQRYAAVADYAHRQWGMQVVLCGGPTAMERRYGEGISKAASAPLTNLIGATDLKQLLAVLERADVLLTSDSGPAHLATAVGTPVIGLYAATNPYQTGPYLSLDWVVNKYPEAVRAEYGRPPEDLAWGIRVHDPAAMERISVDEVNATLARFMARRRRNDTVDSPGTA